MSFPILDVKQTKYCVLEETEIRTCPLDVDNVADVITRLDVGAKVKLIKSLFGNTAAELERLNKENVVLLKRIADIERRMSEQFGLESVHVHDSSMAANFSKDAIDVAVRELERSTNLKQASKSIEDHFRNKYGGTWQCIIGALEPINSILAVYETEDFIAMTIGNLDIVLYKTMTIQDYEPAIHETKNFDPLIDEAIEVTLASITTHESWDDRAEYIQRYFDATHGRQWFCMLGEVGRCSGAFLSEIYIIFSLGKIQVILGKYPLVIDKYLDKSRDIKIIDAGTTEFISRRSLEIIKRVVAVSCDRDKLIVNIRHQMNVEFGQEWQCFIGKDFKGKISFNEKDYLHLKLGQDKLLLFRSHRFGGGGHFGFRQDPMIYSNNMPSSVSNEVIRVTEQVILAESERLDKAVDIQQHFTRKYVDSNWLCIVTDRHVGLSASFTVLSVTSRILFELKDSTVYMFRFPK
ncbi:hypothetical protein HDE_04118 [Halotydeus destructor]|nr:hypothetical protein HDE_04118 [Halotydeus destructor]